MCDRHDWLRDDWKALKTFDGVSYECTIVYQIVLGFFLF